MSETGLMVPSNLSHNVSVGIETAKSHLTQLPSLGGSNSPVPPAQILNTWPLHPEIAK